MNRVLNPLRLLFPGLAAALLAGQLAACVVVLPDGSSSSVDIDYPQILTVDAGCDVGDWWILTASVDHDDGPDAILDVWVEVELVYYDDFDNQFFDDYLGSIGLDPLGATDWRLDLAPGDTFLDCQYPGEYLFRFFAEDADGDLSSADLIN